MAGRISKTTTQWRRRRWWRPALTAAVALATVAAGGVVTVANAATTTWRDFAAGEQNTCGIRSDTTLWCWGSNAGHGIGLADGTYVTEPARVGGQSKWERVSLGDNHGCGLRDGGKLYCWGANHYGQLGLGDQDTRETPTRVGSDSYLRLSVDWSGACAVRTDRLLFCWGHNSDGQLGLGDRTDRLVPTKVNNDQWASISEGGTSTHRCAIQLDDSAYCWGDNAYGKTGGHSDETRPHKIPGDIAWKTIQTGNDHTCGRSQTNRLYCWGRNNRGQLGIGEGVDATDDPTRVVASDWRNIALGADFTCGLEADDAVKRYCWGRNGTGQLGLNDTADRDIPKRRSSETIVWKALVAGDSHVCGFTTDYEMYCWGSNVSGQLGNGEYGDGDSGYGIYEKTPQKVGG